MSDQQISDNLEMNLDDILLPFFIKELNVRGRIARLGPTVDTILKSHNYSEDLSRLLAEAIVLSALIGTALKFEGRFLLQIQSDGPVSLILVDFDKPGQIRACAKFDPDLVEANHNKKGAPLLGQGNLAMTIDPGKGRQRYQGIVPLTGDNLSEAADHYFRQSEQLPTMVKLAVAEVYGAASFNEENKPAQQWRAGGVFIQHLPEEGEHVQVRDIPSGKDDEYSNQPDTENEDWKTAKALLDTVTADELTDPTLTAEQLIYRLFNESTILIFDKEPVEHECKCSDDRIREMLSRFTAEDFQSMIEDNKIIVTCEFCNSVYKFNPDEFLDQKTS